MTNINYNIINSLSWGYILNPFVEKWIIIDKIFCVNDNWESTQSGSIFATIWSWSMAIRINHNYDLWFINDEWVTITNNTSNKILCSTISHQSKNDWGKYWFNKWQETSEFSLYLIAIFTMIFLYISPYLLILYFYKKRNTIKTPNTIKNEK